MSNVIDLNKVKRDRGIKEAKIKCKAENPDRWVRIENSLNKINKLMAELRSTKNK